MFSESNEICISASWDPEAQVWVAVSDDVPGLVAEASSLQKLISKLQVLVPELCELNNHLMKAPSDKISISADYKRFEEELQVS
ncbi:MAG: DUF1902 domain-containing protein [Acidiferrobacterales bacterium]|nr:DUF1902 domain-containing protein [Acidiferrobacterales bacterium]